MNPKSLFATVFYTAGLLALIGSCAKEDLGPREFAQLDFVEIVGVEEDSILVRCAISSIPDSKTIIELGFLEKYDHNNKGPFTEGPFPSNGKKYPVSFPSAPALPYLFTGKVKYPAYGKTAIRAYAVTREGTVLGPTTNFEGDPLKWEVTHFAPLSGKPGDTITIFGKNLPMELAQYQLGLGTAIRIPVQYKDTKRLQFVVPGGVAPGARFSLRLFLMFGFVETRYDLPGEFTIL